MRQLFTCICLLTGYMTAAQQTASSSEREIVFQDVNVIPMNEDRVIQHQDVVVEKGRIKSIGATGKTKLAKTALIVNAKDKYLIPGLAEMHAHVPPIDDLEPMKEVVKLFALNGITTIRGMLGHPKHLELREMIRKGQVLSPHFYTTGPSINGNSVTSPSAGAAMVRDQKKAGYDYLKLHPGLTREKFDSVAITAKRVGIPFVGHVSFKVGVWHAAESGYSSIDHLDGFIEGLVPGIENMNEDQTGPFGMQVASQADTTQIPRLMKALKSHHVWVVPTQALAERWFSPHYSSDDFRKDPNLKYMKPETVEQWTKNKDNLMNDPDFNVSKAEYFVTLRKKLIKECQKNGIGLLLGSDAPQIFNVPGFSAHQELEYLVLAGLTPYQALRSGTVNVAAYLNQKNSGSIQTGYVADLILLNGNPLSDIKQTLNISGVMLEGKWLDRNFIDTELKKLVKQ